MIIDKLLKVSANQVVTATAASTDTIDFGQVSPNTGLDDRTAMVFTVSEAVAAAGAATVTFVIQDSADNSAFADVVATGAISKDQLKAGQQVVLPMPTKLRRYVRANYVVASGPLTAGKISAQVVTGIQQNAAHPDAI